jgi:integral membrane protein
MKELLGSPMGRLRFIGMAEGLSLLVLLGIAMPLKYLANQPEAVKIVGWIHGLLFVAFVAAVLVMYYERNWPFKKVVVAFIAAFLPFGTFVFDAQLKKEEQKRGA